MLLRAGTLGSLLVILPCLAQQGSSADPPAPPSTESPRFAVAATLDTFYSLDLNHPISNLNQFQNFDAREGLQLNAAEITLEQNGPRFGFHLDGGFGEMFRIMNLPDPWGGANRYVSQAYFVYKPLRDSGLRVDVGKFYTSAGQEAPETSGNFNYSRSVLFVLGDPYYHLGVRVTAPLSHAFSAGVQLLNGWNDVRDNNSGKTIGLTSSLTRKHWAWSQAYLGGPEKSGANQGLRHLYDSTLNFTPRGWIAGYMEILAGIDRRVGSGSDRWSGVAAAGKFSFAKRWGFNPRIERFNDTTGFASGAPQHLMETTATVDYRLANSVLIRSEFRRDWSDHPCFDRGAAARASKSEDTIVVGLVVNLKKAL